MIVALDGPAGVGKSTIAKLISERNKLFYLNSGNFYRAVTFSLLEAGDSPEDQQAVIDHALKIEPSLKGGRLHLGDKDIEDQLHSDRVDRWVAAHSAVVAVREEVNRMIREICSGIDLVCEGRDMTTVVFPDADYKFFMDASPAVRARRRYEQGTSKLSLKEIEQSILERDHIDRNKKVGSLKISNDAIYIDTSDLTIEAVCEKVEMIILSEKE